MSNTEVWSTFPRATWKTIQADRDRWCCDVVDEHGIVVVVDEEGREVDAIAAPWLVLDGLSAVSDMATIRSTLNARFPARMEAQRRELAELEAQAAEWRARHA